ncbi:acyl carrier protein [Pseudomonas kilonensis]
MHEVESEAIRILADCLSIDYRGVKVELRLVEDLCIDSMSMVEIVMVLNEAFGIELPEEKVGMCRTVKDICSLIGSEYS